jgi:predicted PurR-regulated permease PerM
VNPLFNDSTVARVLLVAVLVAGVYFFSGFAVPVLAALIICFASWPLYQSLYEACGYRKILAASIAVGLILLCIIIPISIAIAYAFQEISNWIHWFHTANQHGIPAPKWLIDLPGGGDWLAEKWNLYLNEPLAPSYVISLISGKNIGGISKWVWSLSSGAASLLLTLVFMLITLFFLYKDGTSLAAQVDRLGERILPIRWRRFSRVVPATVSSTVIGMGLIAMGEGVVLGIAYWIAGVPSPVAFGVLTGFMALIPGGAPLSFTLISVYLVGTGNMSAGVGLFVWGTVELFIVDKTLRPRLVGGPIKLPFLPTFFGLIGGVKTMGLVGLFVGPVLMALLVAMWREWLHEPPEHPALAPPSKIDDPPAH